MGFRQPSSNFERSARLEGWASDRFALSEAPGFASRLATRVREHVPRVDEYVDLPAKLASLHRVDEHEYVLTETARRAMREGPDGARAYVSENPRPSLAARRLAEQGWWPGIEPTFVGRLDADVHPDVYRPSIPLVDELAEQGRWSDAHRVAARLPVRQARTAQRAIVHRQVRAGVTPRHLCSELKDEFLWQSARLAAERDNLAAAQAFVAEMEEPQRRAVAEHEIRARLGQLEPPSTPIGGAVERGVTGMRDGSVLLINAELCLASARPGDAWTRLYAAATAPRRCGRYWVDGNRPDLLIAQQLLYVSLKHGHRGPWPWGRRRQVALLDRLDAVRPVIDRLATRQVHEALDEGAIRPNWLKARIRQALFIRSVERIEVRTIERHLHRSPQAEAFLRGLMGDLAFADRLSRDPSDPIRALYDDGLARSTRAARRRFGLLQAARRTLQASLTGHEYAIPAAEIRLHTMARLGGERARRTLAHQMQQTSPDHRLYPSMTRALVRIDGRKMLPRLFGTPESFGNRFDAIGLHRALEEEHLVPRGFSAAVDELREAVRSGGATELNGWWYGLCRHWWSVKKGPPSEGILRWLAAQSPETLRAGPRATLARFEDRQRALTRIDQTALLRKLATDPASLETMVTATPFSSRYGQRWSLKHWQRLIARLAGRARPIGWPDTHLVDTWARKRPLDVALSLLAGHPPLIQLERTLVVADKPRYQVRYLHKCRDVLRFWRFADTVNCCFNSNFGFYLVGDTQKQILRLWRDPLSFCFETLLDEQPVGFVFGGFGLTPDGRDALLLNGIYQRPSADLATRTAIIDTIVEAMQRPLRLDVVGVANKNGGRGPLPAIYKTERRNVWRYRALRDERNQLVQSVFDDISLFTNRWESIELCWLD